MRTRFIEATHKEFVGNWGKFLVGRFDAEETARKSALLQRDMPEMASSPLLRAIGKDPFSSVWVLDLQTGEGAFFTYNGSAVRDLEKHRVWVCPLFEPFLVWLYARLRENPDIDALPALVELSVEEAPFDLAGYRRAGTATDSFPGVPPAPTKL